MRLYTRDNTRGNMGTSGRWRVYRNKTLFLAIRIDGPFEAETCKGKEFCQDGYVVVDAQGWPYPIAAEEFERIYEEEK